MRYVTKPTEFIEAEQWFKNGDHSEDECEVINHGTPEEYLSEGKLVRRFRRPEDEYAGTRVCPYCDCLYHYHGWIDTHDSQPNDKTVWFSKNIDAVCPGDYIIKLAPKEYRIVSQKDFEEKWEQSSKLSAIEALYGFMGWLTTRKRAVTFSSAHEAALAGQLISRFASVQKLGNPRGDWDDDLVPMADHEILLGDEPDTKGILTSLSIQVVRLLQTASTLVGNSEGNEDLCDQFQKDLRQFAQENALRIVTYSRAKTGEELIKEERRRQIEEEGFTPEHDDKYLDHQLRFAAQCYTNAANDETTSHFGLWPWDEQSWKPTTKLANLIKAGALWQAEIDRVKRIFGGYKLDTISTLTTNLRLVIMQINKELRTPKKDK